MNSSERLFAVDTLEALSILSCAAYLLCAFLGTHFVLDLPESNRAALRTGPVALVWLLLPLMWVVPPLVWPRVASWISGLGRKAPAVLTEPPTGVLRVRSGWLFTTHPRFALGEVEPVGLGSSARTLNASFTWLAAGAMHDLEVEDHGVVDLPLVAVVSLWRARLLLLAVLEAHLIFSGGLEGLAVEPWTLGLVLMNLAVNLYVMGTTQPLRIRVDRGVPRVSGTAMEPREIVIPLWGPRRQLALEVRDRLLRGRDALDDLDA